MNISKPQVKTLIENKDYNKLNQLLLAHPNLANEGITIPFDPFCRTKAHPLHRVCDGVFAGKITDNEAVKLAMILLDNGADIDGDKMENEGTPLLAAASLHAEQVGIFYIENGADVHYTYKNDGASALHWAAFCGRDKLVEKLIEVNAAIDEPDEEHKSTPIGWALHAMMTKDKRNVHKQVRCIKLLLKAGADTGTLSKEKAEFLNQMSETDSELQI